MLFEKRGTGEVDGTHWEIRLILLLSIFKLNLCSSLKTKKTRAQQHKISGHFSICAIRQYLNRKQTLGLLCWAGILAGQNPALFWIGCANLCMPKGTPMQQLQFGGLCHACKHPKICFFTVFHSMSKNLWNRLKLKKKKLPYSSPQNLKGKHRLSKVNIYCISGCYLSSPGTAGPRLDPSHCLEPILSSAVLQSTLELLSLSLTHSF